jgi:hypothetical protein
VFGCSASTTQEQDVGISSSSRWTKQEKEKNPKEAHVLPRFNTEEQFTIQLFYYLMIPDVQILKIHTQKKSIFGDQNPPKKY